jgi:hypothetical protein
VLKNPMHVRSMMRQPLAFLPVAMSLAALAMVLGNVAVFGVVHDADEGTAAHLFQLLMGLQIPLVAFFAIKWLAPAPKQTLCVLVLQAAAALAALAELRPERDHAGRAIAAEPNAQ